MYRKITDDIVVIADISSNIEKLGGTVWMVDYNPEIGYHLVRQPEMSLPSKVYGQNTSISEKIFDTFKLDGGKTTGVMLQGEKGTGKTLTAIEVCLKALSENYPVILIQSEFYGSSFNDFMASIGESCVVFIDEFEKVFKKQDAIDSTLMLLDGAIKTHKLFLLTSNIPLKDSERMEFLTNRPSRIKYIFEYGSMAKEVIEEYLQDNLNYPVYTDDIISLQRSFNLFTIDMLKAIVGEINRFGNESGSPKVANIINDLNVRTDRGLNSYTYDRTISFGDLHLPLVPNVHPDMMYFWGSYHLNDMVENDEDCTLLLYLPQSAIPKEKLDIYLKKDKSTAVKFKLLDLARCSMTHAISEDVAELIPKFLSGQIQLAEELDRQILMKLETEEEKVTFIQKKMLTQLKVIRVEMVIDHDNRESELFYFTQDNKTRAIILNFKDSDVKVTFKPNIGSPRKNPTFII